MINWFMRAFAMILALFVYSPLGKIETYEANNKDAIQINFSVFADMHLETFTKDRFITFGETLRDLDAAEDKSDVLIFAGDNTMNGQVMEQSRFYGLMKKYNTIDNVIMACGNHDICPGQHNTGSYEDLKERFINYNNAFFDNKIEHMYYSRVVNGYHFIVLSSDKDAGVQQFISEEQFRFIENELKAAEKSKKPVFIINHWPVNNIYPEVWSEGHVGDQSERLLNLMKKYDNRIFYFTGHLHMGLFDDNSHIVQEEQITYINIPGLGVDNINGDADHQERGMGLQVEVYEDSVNVRVRNFAQHEWTGFDYDFPINY